MFTLRPGCNGGVFFTLPCTETLAATFHRVLDGGVQPYTDARGKGDALKMQVREKELKEMTGYDQNKFMELFFDFDAASGELCAILDFDVASGEPFQSIGDNSNQTAGGVIPTPGNMSPANTLPVSAKRKHSEDDDDPLSVHSSQKNFKLEVDGRPNSSHQEPPRKPSQRKTQ